MQNENATIACIKKYNMLDEKGLADVQLRSGQAGKSVLNIIKEEKLLGEDDVLKIVAAGQNIEFINLSPDDVDPMAAHMIPDDMCNEHTLVGVKLDGKNFYVAMSSPMNLAVRNQIEIRSGCKVVPMAAVPAAIKSAIRYHFNVQNVTKQTIASMRLKKDPKAGKAEKDILKDLQSDTDPISNLVSSIISGAIDAGASDIHVEPQESDMKVRYRIDGVMHKEIDIPNSAQSEVLSHIKIIANMDISEKRLPQDGHLGVTNNGREYDLRVSSLPSVTGEKIVLRILDKSSSKWSLDDIVTSKQNNQTFRRLIENPSGMVLLTGPTGSGKTTTLYSLLQLLNTGHKNIVTVEDPVEYRLEGITQVQINNRAGLTFASALRSILRQDPDIILIGEIRDLETAEIAVSAAMTGHLVLCTLHTNDAAGAISRFLNLGIPPFMLASSLLGSVAQRLIRTCCDKCKQPYPADKSQLDVFKNAGIDQSKMTLYKGDGCDKCSGTGYRGRKGIYEILPISKNLRNMIIANKSDSQVKEAAISEGMKTLKMNGFDDVIAGRTTIEEMWRVVDMGGN